MKLIKTGVAGLDEFLHGGLPSRVLLLMGLPGSGNEVFARQTAYTRAQRTGVTYFTFRADPEFVKEDMACYGWDVTPLEKSGSWKFVNLLNAESIVETVTKEVKKGRCIVVDSLSELLITHPIEDAINLLTALAVENRQTEEFHLMLLIKGMHEKKDEITMEHFAEGVIVFNTNWTGDFTNRDFRIRKMKGTLIPSRKLPYSIGEKGLRIETAIRIT
jgi:KaiC/GvpD/RAD55 family RecA-like ATPase